ncbi:tetratricopeptide repeat protein [Anaerobacillus sp. CMMVII]|uniref:tetratricopeptide repeat protein n=1 Tax=Anaerobacillus sp. CMMVII TaxID=2755588 RepID=UPI0021B7908B|nr:tetratricopeptide repeat protein [Anaerobacillus sp. CMMVII]MCT8137838.1 tetratricopeptide repeat protein [Anaerobacillus sp. CMMVII]
MMRIELKPTLEYGKIIAMNRMKQSITQEELARGLCSITYLSKLENGKLEQPNAETVQLLLERLGISMCSLKEHQKEIKELISSIYACINEKNHYLVDQHWTQLNEIIEKNDDPSLYVYYLLISYRYFLSKEDRGNATENRNEILLLLKTLTSTQLFYFHYFDGIFHCLDQKFLEGIRSFQKALSVQNNYPTEDPFLLYHTALAYSNVHNTTLALQYALDVLDVFEKKLNYLRVIDCHIIIGINYTRIKQYDRALEHYNNVLKVVHQFNKEDLIAMVYHNIGFLYSEKKASKLAIDYFLKSLELKKEMTPVYLNTVYFLANELIKVKQFDQANDWINKSLSLITSPSTYSIKLKLLAYSISGNSDEHKHYLLEEAVPFYKEKNDFKNLYTCYELLGDLYSQEFKYKASSKYYKLALNVKNKQ